MLVLRRFASCRILDLLRSSQTATGIRDERVPVAFCFHRQKLFIRISRILAVQPFLCTPEVVVDRRENVEGGNVIEKNGGCFAATLHTILEISLRLGKAAEVQVGAAAIESQQP